MKISDRQIQSVIEAYQKRLQGLETGLRTDGARRAREQSDRLELSPDARELARLAQLAKQLPEVREDLIRQVAQALKDGSYHVPAREVADKMVARFLADHLQ